MVRPSAATMRLDVAELEDGRDAHRGIPGRRRLSWCDRPDGRRIEPGLAGPTACPQGCAQCAHGRPRRHRVRASRVLRESHRHAGVRRARGGWTPLQQHAHHCAVLAEPCLHRHRAQPPQQRHGLHHRVRDRLPGLQRHHALRERHAVRDAAAARLQHVHGGQVAPHAEQPGDGGGPLRPLAAGAGLPALLRLPGWRHEPVVSGARLRQPPGRAAADARGGLPPHRGPRRQVDRVHHGPAPDRPRQALLPAPLLRGDARAAPRAQGVGRPIRRPVRPGLGCLPRGGLRAPEGAGHHRGRRRAVAPRPGRARVGVPVARGAPALRPDDGGLRGLPQPHRPPPGPPARLPARGGRARRHHRHGHL